MLAHLLNGGAALGVVAEESADQILEVVAEAGASDVREVGVDLAIAEKLVEVILLTSLLEGEHALDNDKEDDSDREHVDLLSLVLLALNDLRSHVGACVTLKLVDSLVAATSEVCELQVQAEVDQKVFKLQVAVDNAS